MKVFGKNVLKETKLNDIRKVYTSRIEIIEYCEKNNIKYVLASADYIDFSPLAVYNYQYNHD